MSHKIEYHIISHRYAAQVAIGDEVLSQGNRSNKLTPEKVTNVSSFMMQGDNLFVLNHI